MLVVVGENDRFAEFVAALNLQPQVHQLLYHPITGGFVVNFSEYFCTLDIITHIWRIFSKSLFDMLLFFRRQFVVFYAAIQNFCRSVDDPVRDKIMFLDSILQRIVEIRFSAFALEYAVGIGVDFALRCRGETDQQTVEIVENRAVFIKNGTMQLTTVHIGRIVQL